MNPEIVIIILIVVLAAIAIAVFVVALVELSKGRKKEKANMEESDEPVGIKNRDESVIVLPREDYERFEEVRKTVEALPGVNSKGSPARSTISYRGFKLAFFYIVDGMGKVACYLQGKQSSNPGKRIIAIDGDNSAKQALALIKDNYERIKASRGGRQ